MADRTGESDDPLCSGQVILAVHQHGKAPFCSGTGILAEELDEANRMFERQHTYGHVPLVEDQLISWLDDHQAGTGTAVGVLGFNLFGWREEDQFIDAVFDAAAKHFSVALLDSGVEIIISTQEGQSRKLSAKNRRLIDRRRDDWKKEIYKSKARGRLLPGLYAHRTYDTWAMGQRHAAAGCDIWVKTLAERGQPTKVNVFRDGMWITYEAPGLETRNFNDTKTFDAIVNITGTSKMYRLAKIAEPSTHLEIDIRRFNRQQQKDYDECVNEIAAALREMAGEPGQRPRIRRSYFRPSGRHRSQDEGGQAAEFSSATQSDPGTRPGTWAWTGARPTWSSWTGACASSTT